ncbi:dihydroneopterin aldolase [Sphingomonas qilianensis]|uniref:Dihydroneopterin aldolase n=1 Tax=Sphingomonas qilianensis TaxID=1736690 RepID=A0ABU9XUT9_9SPHN
MSIVISVSDLPLSACIGINPDEAGRRQPLIVSVDLTLAAGAQGADLTDSVDYRRIVAEAEAIADAHIGMIETFAQMLARRCLSLGPVRTAVVTVVKPQALPHGLASVRVMLDREQPLFKSVD